MLTSDLGAAPAASIQLQEITAANGSVIRRDRQPEGSDDDSFGEMFDRFAGDAPTADAGVKRDGARPAPLALLFAPPDAVGMEAPDAGVSSPQGGPVKAGEPNASVKVEADDDEDVSLSISVIDPRLLPANPTVPLPSAGPSGEAADVAHGAVSADWSFPVKQPLAPRPMVSAVPGEVINGLPEPEAETLTSGSAPAGVAVAEPKFAAARAEPTPLTQVADTGGAAIAALRAAQDLPADAQPQAPALGVAAVVREAPASRADVPSAPTPRQVALSALRAALGQQLPVPGPDAAPVPMEEAPATSAPAGEATPLAATTGVPPTGLAEAAAAAPTAAAAGLARAVTHASKPAGETTTLVVHAPVESSVERPSAQVPPEIAADAVVTEGAPAAERARPEVGSPLPTAQSAATTVSLEAANRATVSGDRSKGLSQDPPQAALPRPARVAQAIAAFQAAATVMANATPAAMHAQVASVAATSAALLDRELPTQIVQGIRVQFDNGGGEARLRLNPGFLGGLTVNVQVEGSSVVASLQASNADVRDWIQRNEQVLRQSLADQGLHLERLVIVDEEAQASTDQDRGRGQREDQEQPQPRRSRRPADQGTFELVL